MFYFLGVDGLGFFGGGWCGGWVGDSLGGRGLGFRIWIVQTPVLRPRFLL